MDRRSAIRSAISHLQAGDLDSAEQIFNEVLRAEPRDVSALHFTGVIFYQRKQYTEAIHYIRQAIGNAPNYADAHNNLGIILQEIGRTDEAASCYRKAIQLNPGFDRAYYNLGTVLKEKWQTDDAVRQYKKAIDLNPHFFEAYNNMGLAFQDQGRLDEAESCYRNALQIKPDFAIAHSNLLLLLNYHARHDAQAVFSEHLRFAEQCAEHFVPAPVSHAHDSTASRRLKIGYVSPDFRRHSVNYFIEPVLAGHDHRHFEIFCYSDVLTPDNVTKRLQAYADHWRTITGFTDEEAARLITRDSIDILIDLAGHTGHNRMLVFARKPAPVAITWLGYPNTTGLTSIDYRIVDSYTDPPGLTDRFCTEKLVRFPNCFLCYFPDADSPEVRDLPAAKNGHITFGSFNYFPKVSGVTADIWSSILHAVPGSRIIMKSRNFADTSVCEYAKNMFSERGISSDRLEFVSIKPSFQEHLDMYNHIDISLDTFPYNGTTTTCESLWMGVPVVSLSGNTHASRVSMSILANTGLERLVSRDPQGYITCAVGLAQEIPKLENLRKTLRNTMVHSALCDAKRFTFNLETRYRQMWSAWCSKQGKKFHPR